DDYKLKRKEKGNEVEETRNTASPTTTRSPKILSTLVSLVTKKLQELTETDPKPSSSTTSSYSPRSVIYATNRLLSLFKPKTGRFKQYKSFFDELQGCYGYLFEHLKTRFMPRKKFNILAQHLQEVMEESLPKMIDDQVKELTKTQVPIYVAQGLIMERQQSQKEVDSSVRNYIPSPVRPRDQDDPQDDAYPEGENDTKRQKTFEHGTFVSGESLYGQDYKSEPGPSTSGNQEQYEDFDFWTDYYATDDDELPTEKVSQELVDEVLQTVDEASLHKVVVKFIFLDDDIEERTSKWVDKYVKKFNPYVRYNVEHWKNPLINIFYINKQRALGKPKEEIYSNSKIVQIIKTYWELGHEHKFITKIVVRRANGSKVSITESDYKNLNKNDIEDMYLLIFYGNVDDYAKTGLLWSLSVFIRSIEKYKMFSNVFELVYGIIYKNSKKEKRVMRHQEIHKFYDATLKRVLEGLKSYNNNVKHGFVTPSISKEDVEYLQLFEEETKERNSKKDFEAKENIEKVQKHKMDEELDQLLNENDNGDENAFMDSIFNNQEDPGTRIEPRSNKESPKAEINADMVPVNTNEEEEELDGDEKKFNELSEMLYQSLEEMLPSMVNKEVNKIAKSTVPVYIAEGLLLERQKTQSDEAAMIAEASRRNARIFMQRQKPSVFGTYAVGESSFGQAMEQDPNPSRSRLGTQEQLDDFDAWMKDARIDDDDEVLDKKISQELMEEMSGEIDEAKLQKAINEMLR
nr:hypothetical protein [Tanacetum cinerariifolium]